MQSRVSEQYSAQTAVKELIKSWSRSWLHWHCYNGVSGNRTRHDLSSHWGCGAGGMVKILTVFRLIYRDHGVSGSRATVPCWLKTDGNQGNIERRKTFNNWGILHEQRHTLDLQKTVKNNIYIKNQKFHRAIGLLGLQCSRFNQHHSVIASYGH